MRTFRGTFSSCLTILLLAGGCAKVGDPLPPIIEVPDPIDQLELVIEGSGSISLLVPPPDPDIRLLRAFRACGQTPANPEEQITEVTPSELSPFGDSGKLVIEDSDPRLHESCSYGVRLVGPGGRQSPLSNVEVSFPMSIPGSPQQLSAEVREEQIELAWGPPEANMDGSRPVALAGYLVNRSHFREVPSYSLEQFDFGRPLTVTVQAVGRRESPMVLSAPATIRLTPIDSFPPPPPVRLSAVSVEQGIQLIWAAPETGRVSGYYVYRRTEGEAYRRVSDLLFASRFVDQAPPVGRVVYYVVTAVDERGNQSRFSEPVRVSISR